MLVCGPHRKELSEYLGDATNNIAELAAIVRARARALARSFCELRFEWVRGHSGHAENERCDQLARSASKNALAAAVTDSP